jgi:hypothetical protein
MVVQLSLVAGRAVAAGSQAEQIEVETAMNIDTTDPRWPNWLVDTVTQHAPEGARRLVAQLAPPLPLGDGRFVPLADVAPAIVLGPAVRD